VNALIERHVVRITVSAAMIGAIAIAIGAWQLGSLIFLLLVLYASVRSSSGGPQLMFQTKL
jgi:hypothetical protein